MPHQIAVVTGAGSGIGRATIRLLGEYGFDIALLGRNLQRLKNAEAELEKFGIRTVTLQVDVADDEAVNRAAELIEEQLGAITVWINAAGVAATGPVLSLKAETIAQVTRVNYLGAVHGTCAALRVMRRRGEGQIINIGFAPRLRGLPLQASVNGAHAALNAFCECVRPEIRALSDKITLTMVNLPWINTPRWQWGRNTSGRRLRPTGRVYEPEVAAHAIARAIYGKHREMTVGTSSIFPQFLGSFMPHLRDILHARRGLTGQYAPDDAAGAKQTSPDDNVDKDIDGAFAAHGHLKATPLRTRGRKPILLTHALRYTVGTVFTLVLFYLFGYVPPPHRQRHK